MKSFLAGIGLLLLVISPALAQEASSTLPELELITAENAEKLTEIARLGDGKISQEVWSPDGRTLALSSSIGIWLYETYAPYKPDLNVQPRLLNSKGIIAFSPNSQLLAAGQYKNAQLWDIMSGQQLAEITVEYSVSSLSFNPNGTILAVSNSWADGCECRTDLWNISNLSVSPTKVISFKSFAHSTYQTVFSPDGHFMVVLSYPGVAHIWDMQTENQIAELPTFGELGGRAQFTPDGNRLIVETSYSTADSGAYSTLSLWDFKNIISGGDLIPLWGDDRRRSISYLALSNDQTLMAAYAGRKQIQFIDLETGQEITRIRSGNVRSMGFTVNDQQFFAADEAGRMWIWDVAQALSYGMVRQALPNLIAENEADAQLLIPNFQFTGLPDPRSLGLNGHQDEVKSVLFMPDSTHLMSASPSGSRDDSARLWDITSQTEVTVFEEHGGVAALSPDGSTFASGQWDGTVQLWNALTGEQKVLLDDGDRDRPSVSAIDFNDSGTLLSAAWTTLNPSAESETNWIRIWDAKTGDVLANLPGGAWGINALQFSPRHLTLASDGIGDLGTNVLKLWDANTFQENSEFDVREGLSTIAYSPDGHLLATAGTSDTVYLWSMNGFVPTIQNTLILPDGDTTKTLAFSPNGDILVGITRYSPKVFFWYLNQHKMFLTLNYPPSSLDFSSDGTLVAIGSTDGTIRILGVPQ